jgi:transcriptional regulator with XRE-family HTH domain
MKFIHSKASKELCQKLVKARENAGLKQSDVESIGLIQSELSKIENGQRKVEFLVLVELAKLYGVDIYYFMPEQ